MNASIAHEDFYAFENDETTAKLRSERDALLTRVMILEATLECVAREAEVPQRCPELSFMAVQRIGSVARQALERSIHGERVEPVPASRRRPLSRIRS